MGGRFIAGAKALGLLVFAASCGNSGSFATKPIEEIDGGRDDEADAGDGSIAPDGNDGGSACREATCPRPNLTVHVDGLWESLRIEPRGERRALHFAVRVENTGPIELDLGASDAVFEPACDGELALLDFVAWELRRETDDEIVASGTLPTTCLAEATNPDDPSLPPRFTCQSQGLSRQASSSQPDAPYCDFADVTDVPPGEYVLYVTVNPERVVPEMIYIDNTVHEHFAFDRGDVCRLGFCGDRCCQDDPCATGGCNHLPDLAPVPGRSSERLSVSEEYFPPGDCAILEGCLGGSGVRRLLRFASTSVNWGPGDLVLGRPEDHPDLFEYSPCHRHYHFLDYASYRLFDARGNVAAEGHKQSFCLYDTTQVASDAGPPRFTCSFQGITAGWGDTYREGLDCQWIDITGVPPGRYFVEVSINEERVIAESNYDNNVERLPIFLYPDGTVCAPHDLPPGRTCRPL